MRDFLYGMIGLIFLIFLVAPEKLGELSARLTRAFQETAHVPTSTDSNEREVRK